MANPQRSKQYMTDKDVTVPRGIQDVYIKGNQPVVVTLENAARAYKDGTKGNIYAGPVASQIAVRDSEGEATRMVELPARTYRTWAPQPDTVAEGQPQTYSFMLGPTANQVSRGAPGAQGIPGPKGDAGDAGLTGPAGPKGDKGDQGNAGPVGAQGPKGDAGPAGSIGAQGPKGDTGPIGPQGPQGVAGPKGEAGATGAAGINATPALKATVVKSVPLIALGGTFSFDVNVPGAAVGMVATVNPDAAMIDLLSNYRAAVVSANTVRVYLVAGVLVAAGNRTFYINVAQ